MSLSPENPQGFADVLEHLQHYLMELTKQQNYSKNNINNTLFAFTT